MTALLIRVHDERMHANERIDGEVSLCNHAFVSVQGRCHALLARISHGASDGVRSIAQTSVFGVKLGGLMAYGPDQLDIYRQAGTYVARILKGETPAEIPIAQTTNSNSQLTSRR